MEEVVWNDVTAADADDRVVQSDVTVVAAARRWPVAVIVAGALGLGALTLTSRDAAPIPDGPTEESAGDVEIDDGLLAAATFDPDVDLVIEGEGWDWQPLTVPDGAVQVGLVDGVPFAVTVEELRFGFGWDSATLWVDEGDGWTRRSEIDGGWLHAVDDVLLLPAEDRLRFSTDLGASWIDVAAANDVPPYVLTSRWPEAAVRRADGNVALVIRSFDHFDGRSYIDDHHPEIDLSNDTWVTMMGPRELLIARPVDGDLFGEETFLSVDDAHLEPATIDFLDEFDNHPITAVIEFTLDGELVERGELDAPEWSTSIAEVDGELVVEAGPSGWRRTASGWVEVERTFAGRGIGDLRFQAEGLVRVRRGDGDWETWTGIDGVGVSFTPNAAAMTLRATMSGPIEIVGETHTLSYRRYEEWELRANDRSTPSTQWDRAPVTRNDDGDWVVGTPGGEPFVFSDDDWSAAVAVAAAEATPVSVLTTSDGYTWGSTELAELTEDWSHVEINGDVALVVGPGQPSTVDDVLDTRPRLVAWIAEIPG